MFRPRMRVPAGCGTDRVVAWKHIRTGLILAACVLFAAATTVEPAAAGDPEDTRDIVGKWSVFPVDSVEFRADGSYRFSSTGLGGKWRISNGKLLTETFFGLSQSDDILGRDTFVWLGETRKRVK